MVLPQIPPAVPSSQEIEGVAREVLNQPEFRSGSSVDLLQVASARLREWIQAMQTWTAENPAMQWLILSLLILVLAGLMLHMFLTLRRVFYTKPTPASDAAVRLKRVLEGAAESWQEALEKARLALNLGNPYRAVWVGHRTLLGILDERSLLRFAKWKTNTDFLRECPRTSAEHDLLARFSRVYETVVYAHRDVEHEQLSNLLDEVDAIQRTLG